MSIYTYLSLGCVEGRRLPILADGKRGWWNQKYDKKAVLGGLIYFSLYGGMLNNNSVSLCTCPAERWQIYFLHFCRLNFLAFPPLLL